MKYDVTAVAMNRHSRRAIGGSRIERIDTATNRLFAGCSTSLAVEQKYESFWNDTNPASLEIVKVIDVVKIYGGRR